MMERKKLIKLVKASQDGDPKAVDALFNAFYDDVYYFALKTVKDEQIAYEITQDTFVSILKNFKDLKEPAAFVTWMKQIAYNHCARFFQKKKDVLVEEDEEGNTVFDAWPEERTEFVPDEALDQEDFRKTILGMIDTLSEEQRSATMLYYYSEMSVKQIAQIQGVSEGTVKSRLNYARKAIKKSVEDYEKKNDVKLHSVALLPMLFWLFAESKEVVPPTALRGMVGGISSATGIAVTGGSTAGGVAAASAGGIAAKLAGIPLVAKVIAGVTATSLVVGCVGTAISRRTQAPVVGPDPICQHEWVDASCDTPKTCDFCGATDGVAPGHTWLDASCEAPKTCSVCSRTEGGALGHTWTDANYQAPKTCITCDTMEGEPLTPDFEKLGIDVITAEMGVEYDHIATCSVDTSKKTVGKVVFRDHRIFTGDEEHEAFDGHEWHSIVYTVTFSDDNAWDYGTSIRTGYASYYRNGNSFDHEEAPQKMFTANYNGVDHKECILQTSGYEKSGWVGRTFTYKCKIAWRVPVGYDGFVFMLYDYFAEWEEGQSFYEFMDENTLYFRFDESSAQEPGTDIPEPGDTTVTEPPVTEPPVTEPPVMEPEVSVYYVPDGCTYIMADGTELRTGEAMPETCSDGDEFVTEAYTYKYGWEYGEDPYGDTILFRDVDIDGWGVGANKRTWTEYPELLSEINGEPLVDMNATFLFCDQMVKAPSIPKGVTSLNATFAGCAIKEAPAIPEGVTKMIDTFWMCWELETAPEIPSSVIDMANAFNDCSSLKEAPKLPSNTTNLDGAFKGCPITTAPEIPVGVTSMSGTFARCGSLRTAPIIPAGVTDLSGTFSGCSALQEVPIIPNGVTNMSYTFEDCTALRTAPDIPEGVTDMTYTFSGCTALKEAPTIPNSVTTMEGTFRYCTSLEIAPIIPNSVTDMSETFYHCTSLHTVSVIPEAVETMNGTFSGCTALTGTIEINATLSDGLRCCFEGTVQPIVLTGSCDKLEELAATAENGNVSVA